MGSRSGEERDDRIVCGSPTISPRHGMLSAGGFELMRIGIASLLLVCLLPSARAEAGTIAFTGTYSVQIWGIPVGTAQGSGVANLGAGSPPDFTIPSGAFVLPGGAVGVQAGEFLTLAASNAQGAFGPGGRKMPLKGLLKLRRSSPFHATATIDAHAIGSTGMAAATFVYTIIHKVGLTFTTVTVHGTAALTGQSFQVATDTRDAAGAGHIQLVAPFSFHSTIGTKTSPNSATLTLDFVPEPEQAAIGAVAVAGLAAVGLVKHRQRRSS